VPRAPELLIVADDLSGALDTAAVFAADGLDTVVVPHRSGWRTAAECFDEAGDGCVLVVDTATRHATPRTAASRVRRIVSEARRLGTRQFYKKTDSTLRGHIGGELAAFRQAAGVDLLPFAPAFPRVGRTTHGGHQLVDGVPLGRTAFARDALNPVRTGSIPRLLAGQAGLSTRIVARPGGMRGARTMDAWCRAAIDAEPSPGVLVFDADDERDLMQVAEALRSAGRLAVTAGSGGFAAALAQRLVLTRTPGPGRRSRPASPAGPLLVVAGSRHPTAVRQLQAAISSGFQAVPVPASLLTRSPSRSTWRTIVGRAVGLMAQGQNVILHAPDEREQTVPRRGQAPLAVATRLGRLAADIVGQHAVGALMASGGDTLAGVSVACGWTRLRAHAELAPGIALAATSDARAPWVVSKAGGFGVDTVWVDVRERFRSRA